MKVLTLPLLFLLGYDNLSFLHDFYYYRSVVFP